GQEYPSRRRLSRKKTRLRQRRNAKSSGFGQLPLGSPSRCANQRPRRRKNEFPLDSGSDSSLCKLVKSGAGGLVTGSHASKSELCSRAKLDEGKIQESCRFVPFMDGLTTGLGGIRAIQIPPGAVAFVPALVHAAITSPSADRATSVTDPGGLDSTHVVPPSNEIQALVSTPRAIALPPSSDKARGPSRGVDCEPLLQVAPPSAEA